MSAKTIKNRVKILKNKKSENVDFRNLTNISKYKLAGSSNSINDRRIIAGGYNYEKNTDIKN